MAAHQFSKRLLATLLLLTLCATWLPSPAQAATASYPNASDILLDVAASHPGLLVRLNTNEDIEKLNIDPYVRVHLYYAIAYGSWILTTRTPVTSGKWTGRPWLAIGGHARYFYFAYESTTPWTGDGSDTGGNQGGVVSDASGQALADFGKDLTAIGLGVAGYGEKIGGPKGKSVQGIGLGIAGVGVAIEAIGLLTPTTPKTGHVDSEGPTGMPAAGGPPGSDPNGPTGASPPGFGPSNGNGNSPSGGASGGGGDGDGGDGDGDW